MNIDKHEIGFDFDGVIADTGEAFIRLACEEFAYCSYSLDDITSFQVQECLSIPSEQVEQIFSSILKDHWAPDSSPCLDPLRSFKRWLKMAKSLSSPHDR